MILKRTYELCCATYTTDQNACSERIQCASMTNFLTGREVLASESHQNLSIRMAYSRAERHPVASHLAIGVKIVWNLVNGWMSTLMDSSPRLL